MSDIEQALHLKIIPWVTIDYRTTTYWIFDNDGKSSIFVPVSKTISDLVTCYKAAYTTGVIGIQNGTWASFHIHQTTGKDSVIDYPFVEMTPVG